MAYIIDTYNRYDSWDREHSSKVFELNGQWYAVYQVELEWGQPQFPERIGVEKDPETYFIYDSEQEAMEFVKLVKSLN